MIRVDQDIERAYMALNEGGIILYPTDTVWGLGCDARNTKAINRIFQLKGRPANKGLIVLLDDKEKLTNYIEDCPEVVCDMIEKAGKPLTVIFPGGKNVSKEVLASDGSIAIRVVKHPFCTPLIHKLGAPLVSTSANISGSSTPSIFSDIPTLLKEGVDYIVENFHHTTMDIKPSSIIRFDKKGNFEFIR